MSWGAYGILVILGLFILLLIVNPNLSCFGKRVKSPFYPLIRRKKIKKIKDSENSQGMPAKTEAQKKAKDYGFHLDRP